MGDMWVDEYTDGWMSGWVSCYMDEQMVNGWVDEQMGRRPSKDSA